MGNIKGDKSFYISNKGLNKEMLNGVGDLVSRDTDEAGVLCAFLPSFAPSSPVRSPKLPYLIRSVQGGEWPAMDEVELGIT